MYSILLGCIPLENMWCLPKVQKKKFEIEEIENYELKEIEMIFVLKSTGFYLLFWL